MRKQILKNIEFQKTVDLKDLVDYQPGQIISRTLIQNNFVSLTLFALDTNEEISSHSSNGNSIVTVLDGSAAICVGENRFVVEKGKTLIMPAGIPHSLLAEQPFKIELIVVFPLNKNCES